MTLDARVRGTVGSLRLDAEIGVDTNETVVLLGPNGAGKTTLLRAVAGLVALDDARVVVDDEVVEDTATGIRVPTPLRRIGLVFQDHLLFPHLSVIDNVAFGPRAAGATRAAARRTARDWLERLGLADHEQDRPSALSGGLSQRVALARALAARPRLLLLDEPFAALDAPARADIRRVLLAHLRSYEGTRVLVTHDAVEAIAVADRIVVLERGRVLQAGTPAEVAARPRSAYVADLAGVNLLRGRAGGGRIALDPAGVLIVPGAPSGEVFAIVHPRAVALHRRRPEGSPRNVWRGRVAGIDAHGDRVRVQFDGDVRIVAEVTPAAVRDLALGPGADVWASVKATEIPVYPA